MFTVHLLEPSSIYSQHARDTFNQASETVQQGLSTGSKEANKSMTILSKLLLTMNTHTVLAVAKDSNASAGTRLEAGKDAIGDKVNEKKHEVHFSSCIPWTIPLTPFPADQSQRLRRKGQRRLSSKTNPTGSDFEDKTIQHRSGYGGGDGVGGRFVFLIPGRRMEHRHTRDM